MYPPNKDVALLAQLTAERTLTELSFATYKHWLPYAQAAVFPALTAAVDDLPPDPNAVVDTQGWWELGLDQIFMYGAGLVYGYELLAVMGAFGSLPTPDVEPEPLDNSSQARQARRIVAQVRDVDAKTITNLDRTLRSMSSIRTMQARHAEAIRPRMVGTPGAVYKAMNAKLDAAQVANTPPAQLRVEISDYLHPTKGDWMAAADAVGRTESAAILSTATIEAAQFQNQWLEEDLEQTWMATIDGKTRKSHWAADGQRVPLGAKFQIGRYELDKPGDPSGPDSETKNCRCRVAVLAVDEELPSDKDRHTERLDGGDSTQKNRDGSQQDEIDRRAEAGNIRAREDPNGLGRVASAAPTTTQEQKMADEDTTDEVTVDPEEETTTEEAPAADDASSTDPDAEQFRTFTNAVVAVLGTPTDDRRILAADMDFRFREFPLPLMWTKQSTGGHYDSFTVGVIESASVDGTNVVASGYLLNTDEADEAASQLAHKVTGPSVDLGDAEWTFTDEDGNEITEDMWWDAEGELKIFETVTSAKLLGVTLVATPAFGETSMPLDPERSGRDVGLVAALLASAEFVEKSYPAAFFADPKLTGPTPITLGADGRITGHLACFGTCHVGFAECVTVPRSQSNYSHFHTSPPVLTNEGGRIQVGRLAVATGHADKYATAAEAVAHYDNTGTCFALVRAGEDEFGVWVSGVIAPGADHDIVAQGLSAPLSGDWRKRGGNLELVAGLAVNTPGFPVVSGASDEQDQPLTLVASLGPKVRPKSKGGAVDTVSLAAEIVRQTRAADRRQAEAAQILAADRRQRALGLISQVGAK